jgi:hypothetical protein
MAEQLISMLRARNADSVIDSVLFMSSVFKNY